MAVTRRKENEKTSSAQTNRSFTELSEMRNAHVAGRKQTDLITRSIAFRDSRFRCEAEMNPKKKKKLKKYSTDRRVLMKGF